MGEVKQQGRPHALRQGDLIDGRPAMIEVEEGIHVGAGVEGSAHSAGIQISRCAGRKVGRDRHLHLDFDRRIAGKRGCRRSERIGNGGVEGARG